MPGRVSTVPGHARPARAVRERARQRPNDLRRGVEDLDRDACTGRKREGDRRRLADAVTVRRYHVRAGGQARHLERRRTGHRPASGPEVGACLDRVGEVPERGRGRVPRPVDRRAGPASGGDDRVVTVTDRDRPRQRLGQRRREPHLAAEASVDDRVVELGQPRGRDAARNAGELGVERPAGAAGRPSVTVPRDRAQPDLRPGRVARVPAGRPRELAEWVHVRDVETPREQLHEGGARCGERSPATRSCRSPRRRCFRC